jgi:branched-chain amino acid transport system substrate-binding protein
MRSVFVVATALALLAAVPAEAQQRSVKIGFVSTFSGPLAFIGDEMRKSFELALDHLGRRMGGLPVDVIYEDDESRPEVGLRKTRKLVESDRINFVVGYGLSSVLLASLKPVIDSQTFLIGTNAGPSQIAGERCSPFFFSTASQNDQTAMAMGEYMNQKNVQTAFLTAPDLLRRHGYAQGHARDLQGPGDCGAADAPDPGRFLDRAVESAGGKARCGVRGLLGYGYERSAVPHAI